MEAPNAVSEFVRSVVTNRHQDSPEENVKEKKVIEQKLNVEYYIISVLILFFVWLAGWVVLSVIYYTMSKNRKSKVMYRRIYKGGEFSYFEPDQHPTLHSDVKDWVHLLLRQEDHQRTEESLEEKPNNNGDEQCLP